MNRTTSFALSIACLAGAGLAFAAAANAPGDDAAARIERGRYLVTAVGCADCHAPKRFETGAPEPDGALGLAGHRQEAPVAAGADHAGPWIASTNAELTAWSGPWGVSFAANLTPDVETGIGSWSEEEFVATIRTGRRRGRGRELLPPMPAAMYRNFSDEDLGAIWAYLRSLPPVSNRVPQPLPPAAQ